MAPWSVNTWLIAICVAVFVIDNLFLARVPVFVETGVVSPSLIDIPPAMVADSNEIGTINGPARDPDGTIQQVSRLVRKVVDRGNGNEVGWKEVMKMQPLAAYFHFSTRLGFLGFEWWRFVGFQFLHANLPHLLFNMIGLYLFGGIVEQYLGRKRYLAFYLLCGIFGAILYLILNFFGWLVTVEWGMTMRIPGLLTGETWNPLVGASAGIFGVIMAGAYLAPQAQVLLFFIIPMTLRTLAYVLVIIAFVTVLTNGNNAGGEAGHLGGAIAGWYFIRHSHHLHGFFDFLGRADPTSHHYRNSKKSRRTFSRAATDQADLDRILAKISDNGLQSLTESEKRRLRQASEQRGP